MVGKKDTKVNAIKTGSAVAESCCTLIRTVKAIAPTVPVISMVAIWAESLFRLRDLDIGNKTNPKQANSSGKYCQNSMTSILESAKRNSDTRISNEA